MKILLHSDFLKLVEKSGVGRAIYHQKKALEENNIEYTTNKKDDYDIVHINTVFPQSYWLSKKAKAKGKKVVYHAHSTKEDFENSFPLSNKLAPLFKKWICKCYNSGDLIITPTPYSKKLIENYGLTKPIVDVSNGIDMEFFKKDLKKALVFRQIYGIAKTDKVVIGVGLLIKRKGLLDFIKLAKMMPEYKFIWFGDVSTHMMTKEVKKAYNSKSDNLRFAGYVPREELVAAYSGADLFFFPTYEETEGIVLLEALSMKIPVLIRDIPIYKDWFEENKTIYKGTDIASFKEKIEGILEGTLPSLVENGYKMAQQKDIKKVGKLLVEQYRNLYEQMC